MGLMDGKKGIVFGVANERSLAWQIALQLHQQGAALGFSHLPDTKMERRVRRLAEPIGAALIAPCDVTEDAQIAAFFEKARRTIGQIDFVVHSIAYASRDALRKPFWQTTRADFLQAVEISTYSLVAICRAAYDLLAPGAAILALTYLGSVAVVPRYNVMGVCKAALESSVRYLAAQLGRARSVRVNALSAGPLRTLSSSGISGFDEMLEHSARKAP